MPSRANGSSVSSHHFGEDTMKRALAALAAGVSLFASPAAHAQTPVNQRFSDTFAYGDLKLQFVFSCYLVKHGDEYMLWDTGHAMTAPNVAPKESLVDLLAKLNVKPEQIKYVGISHYHG